MTASQLACIGFSLSGGCAPAQTHVNCHLADPHLPTCAGQVNRCAGRLSFLAVCSSLANKQPPIELGLRRPDRRVNLGCKTSRAQLQADVYIWPSQPSQPAALAHHLTRIYTRQRDQLALDSRAAN